MKPTTRRSIFEKDSSQVASSTNREPRLEAKMPYLQSMPRNLATFDMPKARRDKARVISSDTSTANKAAADATTATNTIKVKFLWSTECNTAFFCRSIEPKMDS